MIYPVNAAKGCSTECQSLFRAWQSGALVFFLRGSCRKNNADWQTHFAQVAITHPPPASDEAENAAVEVEEAAIEVDAAAGAVEAAKDAAAGENRMQVDAVCRTMERVRRYIGSSTGAQRYVQMWSAYVGSLYVRKEIRVEQWPLQFDAFLQRQRQFTLNYPHLSHSPTLTTR